LIYLDLLGFTCFPVSTVDTLAPKTTPQTLELRAWSGF